MSRAHPSDLTSRIQTQAYHLWEAAGRPPGDGFHFWLEAERMILQASRTRNPQKKPRAVKKAPARAKKTSRHTAPKKDGKTAKISKQGKREAGKSEKKAKKKKEKG